MGRRDKKFSDKCAFGRRVKESSDKFALSRRDKEPSGKPALDIRDMESVDKSAMVKMDKESSNKESSDQSALAEVAGNLVTRLPWAEGTRNLVTRSALGSRDKEFSD